MEGVNSQKGTTLRLSEKADWNRDTQLTMPECASIWCR